jgi:cell division protein FtsW
MEEKRKGHIDWFILIAVIALMLFSISFVQSASSPFAVSKSGTSEKFFLRHAVMVIAGIGLMIFFSQIDYNKYKKFTKYALIVSIGLLGFVLFFGIGAKGASRWISLGFIQFQPSELAKFALIGHIACLLSTKNNVIKTLEFGFIPIMIWVGLVCALVAAQPNYSTTIAIAAISFIMMFIGGVRLKHLIVTGIIGLIGGGVMFLSASYRYNRVMAYLGMGSSGGATESVSYQSNQALLAIGNGGMFGLGPGQSRQSHLFLPESYGDFIFSVIGEEYGFIGLTLILIAFMIIIWRGFIIAKKAPNAFGYYLASGILITFSIYVLVNAGVNTSLLPTTGVPFPFLSYGGTATLIYSSAIGILLNISAQANVFPRKNFSPSEDSQQEFEFQLRPSKEIVEMNEQNKLTTQANSIEFIPKVAKKED